MKLFHRIFATFCMVIILAIFIVSFSFWLIQEKLAQSQFSQQRSIEINLLSNALMTFQSQGERATRELLDRWGNSPASRNVLIISGNNKRDLLGRKKKSTTPTNTPSSTLIPI